MRLRMWVFLSSPFLANENTFSDTEWEVTTYARDTPKLLESSDLLSFLHVMMNIDYLRGLSGSMRTQLVSALSDV